MIGSIRVRNSLGYGGDGKITYCLVFLDYIMRLEGLEIGTRSWRELSVCLTITHLSSLSSVPNFELNLCWWLHSEEGEAVPALEELTNPLPR